MMLILAHHKRVAAYVAGTANAITQVHGLEPVGKIAIRVTFSLETDGVEQASKQTRNDQTQLFSTHQPLP